MKFKFKTEIMDRDGEIEMKTGSKIAFVLHTLPDHILVTYFEPVSEDE